MAHGHAEGLSSGPHADCRGRGVQSLTWPMPLQSPLRHGTATRMLSRMRRGGQARAARDVSLRKNCPHQLGIICDNGGLDMRTDDLLSLKDDMVAFIEGHGMHRLPGYVGEEVPSVLWEDENNPDSWKDFVEMAKASSAPFVTMSEVLLEKEDLELLLEQLRDQNYPDEEAPEIDEAQYLVNFVGKLGYVQLGFAHQGVMFLHENSTPWYERYQQLLESVEDFGDIVFENRGDEEEES